MSDPIERLESFDPGDSMTPLPAADVRRRGDRLRRRNTALVAVGAAAAVALIATPLALISTGGESRTVEPAPAPSISDGTEDTAEEFAGLTEIPAGFPLDAGFPDRSDDVDFELRPPGPDDSSPVYDLQSCGEALMAPAREIDFLGTGLTGPENGRSRQLLLFETPGDAQAVSEAFRSAYEDCPIESYQGGRTQTTVVDGDLGPGSWVAGRTFGPVGQQVVQAVTAGNALLLVTADNEGNDPPSQAEQTAAELPEVLAAMQVFAERGFVPDPTSTEEPTEPTYQGSGDVPGDFPLEEGITPDGDGEFFPPAPDVEGVVFPDGFCGTGAWPADVVTGRLATLSTGPEFSLTRELVAFETADEAVAVLAGLRTAVQECPQVGAGDQGDPVVFADHDVDSGYDDATFSYTYETGLGGVVYQFVRVGRGVLATATGGEWSPQTARVGARELNDDNRVLTGQMCVFAAAGC